MVHAVLAHIGACLRVIALDDVPPALDRGTVGVHLGVVVPGVECGVKRQAELQKLLVNVLCNDLRTIDADVIIEHQLVVDLTAVVLDLHDIGVDVAGIALHLDLGGDGVVVA